MLAGVTGTLTSLALIVVFVTIGGFFSGSELAVLTLRESQVERLPGRGGERVRRLRAGARRVPASLLGGGPFPRGLSSADRGGHPPGARGGGLGGGRPAPRGGGGGGGR